MCQKKIYASFSLANCLSQNQKLMIIAIKNTFYFYKFLYVVFV